MVRNSVDIYTELSKKYGISRRVVEYACSYIFIYTRRAVLNRENEKTIMIKGLGKFKLKSRYVGKKSKTISEKELIKQEKRKLKLEGRSEKC